MTDGRTPPRRAALRGAGRTALRLAGNSVAAAALLALMAGSASAQNTDKNPLGVVKHLKCAFSVTAAGSWKGGAAAGQVKDEALDVEIVKIDVEDGTAQFVGATGPVHVTALLTGSSVHFLERAFQGNLTVTTVFAPADKAGKFKAVRSRHDYMLMNIPGFVAEPTVQQRYGACEASPE